MSTDTVIAVIAVPACVIYLILTRRSIRMMRGGDEEWRQQWRQLDRERRRSIHRCMKRGEAVIDRADAELAVGAAAQVDHVRKATAPTTLMSQLFVLAILVLGVISGSTILIIGMVVALASGTIFDLLARRQQHQYRKSIAATQRVHDLGHPLSG